VVQFDDRPPSTNGESTTKGQSPDARASDILSILTTHGDSDYIGEPISQIAHSLQCANLASRASADAPTIVAALLHDLGQIIPSSEAEKILGAKVQDMHHTVGVDAAEGATGSDSVGRIAHETLGAKYLLALGFPSKVAQLVEAHVPAKRYLCATEPGYYGTLSEASKESLKFQGGPMSSEEVRQWDQGKWAGEKAALRRWDDGAKVVGLDVPGIEAYRSVIEEVLSS